MIYTTMRPNLPLLLLGSLAAACTAPMAEEDVAQQAELAVERQAYPWQELEIDNPSDFGFDWVESQLVYDAGRGAPLVVVAQMQGNSAWPQSVRTFELAGQSLVEVGANGQAPSPRLGFAVAYDSLRDRTILFGGYDDELQPLADTWEWDGANWTEIPMPTQPEARGDHAMAFNPSDGRIYLYGGSLSPHPRCKKGVYNRYRYRWEKQPCMGTSGAELRDDLWAYDGSQWSKVSDGATQVPRYKASLVYDAPRARMMLHGGTWPTYKRRYQRYDDSPRLRDSWSWESASGWTKVADARPGGPVDATAMIFDEVLRAPVLIGRYNKTWVWQQSQWSSIGDQRHPHRFYGPVVAVFDTSRGATLAMEVWDEPRRFMSATPTVGNRAPELSSGTRAQLLVGESLELQLEGSDPEGDPITISLASSLPDGASFDAATSRIVWTPSAEQAGSYPIVVQLSDGQATSTETVTIEVESRHYGFLPQGSIGFEFEIRGISCMRRIDGPLRDIDEAHGWGQVRCEISGTNPGAVYARCSASVPVLIPGEWGYSSQGQVSIGGSTTLGKKGSLYIRDEYRPSGSSFMGSEGRISVGMVSGAAPGELRASASVNYRDWRDQSRTWTHEAGHAVVEIE